MGEPSGSDLVGDKTEFPSRAARAPR